MTKGSIARPNRPMSPRKAALEAERRWWIGGLGCERDICSHPDCPAAVKQHPETGRWFITMGHPGFNSRVNNRDGYAMREAAFAAFRRFSSN